MSYGQAKCERTGKIIPLLKGAYVASPGTGEWEFVAIDAPERHADIGVPVAALMKSPEALLDWIAGLSAKQWFDAKKLTDFFARIAQQNNLRQSL